MGLMTYNSLNSLLYALYITTETSDQYHLKKYKLIAIRDNESVKTFNVLRNVHCTIQLVIECAIQT